jgi:acyl dehydratase
MVSAIELAQHVGREVGVSDWIEVNQPMIDRFADATMDHQFIHVDVERVAGTPLGGTIAHGFLTLSLLSRMADDALPRLDGIEMALNYGLNRVRFVSPVRAGKRVRGRFVLAAVEARDSNRLLRTYDVTIEIDGESKPALVAQWLTLAVLSSGTQSPAS